MSSDDNHVVLKELLAGQMAGKAVVLATVVKARGPVPRHAGTKMVVYENHG
jgi:xanthine/CO dehydrogenase XdhC/CoxF family maturation factor